ncbi:hypothetical protein GLYMA_20G076400v4 [Glycine max]|uniref:Uncharacterized protein n=2 Tax=Glycine max TaxID=3847 RepID=A0A0R0E8V9_SOYBN|nr:uncharacterized protein LOC100806135 isoform X2 [Glycine max]KAH1035041.1 hypothetical protein GYH30_055146 [Glycine max]KRG90230.1 hypothetical protein GLYMA_20G076400v4 [Glycine max]|eukprot:XP_006605725.1 uncharacterized protein LOC100806135 isoform X2 [Glycine max]
MIMILVKLVKLAFVTGIWPMHGSTKYRNASRMLGDQLALASVEMSKPHFDTSKFAKALAFSEDIGGSSILFLPCSMYNWTLPEGAGQFHDLCYPSTRILGSCRPHF